ncbi:MAG: nodulation protein NfeD [Chloroflexota bacterium]|nr:nodulation protein NfeD [Chloroflexota bacterium]
MKRSNLPILLALLMVLTTLPAAAQGATEPVVVVEVEGVINPFSAQYLERGLRLADQRGAQALIITLDTPGGLESAMREMVQALLEAPLPTVVYVAPRGARATSAGMFVLLAADVAAMAPATHVGAAHPVPLGTDVSDVMDEKTTSDAAALVRSIATTRGRNAEWAERAVRENLSVTTAEALELNVIDLVAEDLHDLLDQLDRREVAGTRLLTSDALVETAPMNLAERFLHVITEPNIAYLLLSLGTLMLLAELADPGLSVPGVGAVVAFALAFVGLGSLPVNWAGIGLLVLSVVFFLVGLLTDTEAVVSIAGLVPFVLGSLLLFRPFSPTSPAMPVVQVSPWLIGVMAVSILAFSLLVLGAILRASRQPPRAGAERLVGRTGTALTDLTPAGQVRVDLADWSAVAVAGEIRAGEPVRVTGIAGVRLQVTPAQIQSEDSSEVEEV